MRPALPHPDFLHPVARPGWLAWAWCGTGLLVLLLAAVDARLAWQQRQQALLVLADAVRAAAPPAAGAGIGPVGGQPGAGGVGQGRSGQQPAAATTAARAAATAAARQDAEAQRWQLQLARPWMALWAAAEAAPEGLRWLSVEHGSNGSLRLSGEVAALAPAQAVAAALRLQQHQGQQVWEGVTLATVQRVPNGQRVELLARLTPALAGARP